MFPGAQRQRVHGPRAQGSRSILPIPQLCSAILTALIPLHTTQTHSLRSAAGSGNSSISSTGGALGRACGWPGAPDADRSWPDAATHASHPGLRGNARDRPDDATGASRPGCRRVDRPDRRSRGGGQGQAQAQAQGGQVHPDR